MAPIAPKPSKHDQYIEQLSQRIGSHYDKMVKGVTIHSQRNRRIAEIDLVGMKGDTWDIFEVKCSHRITKARIQLQKIRKVLPKQKIRKAFFFCGESGLLLPV